MVRQYRPAMNTYTLEFPAGEVHKNESPIQAAKREVLEELQASSVLVPVGSYSLMMNRTNIKNYLFVGLELSFVHQKKPEDGIKIIEVTRKQLKNMIIKNNYFQLAGLGIFQIVKEKHGIDLLNDPVLKSLSIFEKTICFK